MAKATRCLPGALFAQAGDLVPAEAGLDQDLFAVLAQLRCSDAGLRGRIAEAHRRTDDALAAELRMLDLGQIAVRPELRVRRELRVVAHGRVPLPLGAQAFAPGCGRTGEQLCLDHGEQLG